MDHPQHVAEHPVADAPRLELVDLDGHRVGDAVDLPGQRDVERAEEALHRVAEEGDQLVERDVGRRAATASGSARNAGRRGRGRAAVSAAASRVGSKVNGVGTPRPPGRDVADVERLQRVAYDDARPHRLGRGQVEGVEQLAERDGRRPRLAGVLVGAGVGDDQRLGGRADGVEQELAVLRADVALAGDRVAGQHVVAVGEAEAREDAVVEPDQAHHPVRHRAHRHHRADGERAGAEVGPRRAAGQVAGQQGPHVGQPHRQVGPVARRRRARRRARAAPGRPASGRRGRRRSARRCRRRGPRPRRAACGCR